MLGRAGAYDDTVLAKARSCVTPICPTFVPRVIGVSARSCLRGVFCDSDVYRTVFVTITSYTRAQTHPSECTNTLAHKYSRKSPPAFAEGSG